jgi:hypothetical protein
MRAAVGMLVVHDAGGGTYVSGACCDVSVHDAGGGTRMLVLHDAAGVC